MQWKQYFIFFGFLLVNIVVSAQLTIHIPISNLPAEHQANSEIYIAGSFNNWNPSDEKFRMMRHDEKGYSIQLNLPAGEYEYKFTRGDWSKTECMKDGSSRPNRKLTPEETSVIKTISPTIEAWADAFTATKKVSTRSANVCIIDTALKIPTLKRNRRVWIYLPPDYCTNTEKRYPVIYMQDGQNLFDELTSFSGEWGIDEFLDSTTLPKSIIVGIDHGDKLRLNEYNPYDHEKFGKGEGELYVKYLAKKLKPFIDKNYRTLRAKEHSFVGGSSMGGLISLYALLRYPKTFGGAAVFSPSFWISGEKIYDDILKYGKGYTGKIYLSAGKEEGEKVVEDMLQATRSLNQVSKAEVRAVIRDGEKHNEAAWKKEFPLFYKWIIQ